MMTEEELAEIEARAGANIYAGMHPQFDCDLIGAAESRWMAGARRDVALLVAEVRRLRGALDEITEAETGSAQALARKALGEP